MQFRMKFLLILVLILARTGLGKEAERKYLDELIAEAIRNNPELKAKREQAEATRYKIKESFSLDAPQAGVEFYQSPVDAFPDPLKDQMEIDYFIQQMFPLPGKLYSMRNSAKSGSLMAEQAYRAKEREIITGVKQRYYELYLIQRKLEINQENQTLMRGFSEISRKQYEVGMGIQADFLRAETELASLVKEGISLEQDRIVAEAMLSSLLGRSDGEGFAEIEGIESEIPDWTLEQIKPLARENNPELKMQEYNIAMTRAELSFARNDYLPDLMVKGTYKDMQDTRDDFWALMLGLSLPVSPWSNPGYSSRLKQSEVYVRKSEAEYSSMENMVNAELKQALAKIQANKKIIQLYRTTIIPQAEQTLNSNLFAYQSGKTEFLMVLDAYRMLLMSKLDYEMAVMEYMSAQAELEKAVGLSVEEIKVRLGTK